MFNDLFADVFPCRNRIFRRFKTAARDERHTLYRCRTCVGDRICRLCQIVDLLRFGFFSALVCRKSHTHCRSRVRSCALSNHIFNRLRDLVMIFTGHKLDLSRINTAVKYSDLAVLIPSHIFISEHKCQSVVRSVHFILSFQE